MSTSPDITDYVNRGPLTTTFTPPTTCFQTASRVVMVLGTSTGTTTYYGHWFKGDTACYPTGTMPASLLQEPTFWGTYLYSPGLHCPRGWSTAGQITGSWQDLDVTGSTSGAICCLSFRTDLVFHRALSYYAKNHQCRRILSESATLTFSHAGVVKTTVLDTTLSVYADGIPLIWESSDRLSIAEPTPPHGATTQRTASQPTSTTSDSSLPSRGGALARSQDRYRSWRVRDSDPHCRRDLLPLFTSGISKDDANGNASASAHVAVQSTYRASFARAKGRTLSNKQLSPSHAIFTKQKSL
ncbi:hypothetical protein CISG_02770 [Coccidioides immitis RMSCC 3703]|uniref:Uncharacterized protein n=1 Tax=Coccidioides immitis RMSCC 3703 TaxID=454286 RepID=A0A0J8U4F4_COCIT|nr:hypothetical protein CISG_02770 [Coccidioides immitis RMSCC 3703]